MANGVFVLREDFPNIRQPDAIYPFPKLHLNEVRQFVDDWIVYYEPRRNGGRMCYFAIARVASFEEVKHRNDTKYLAHIEKGSFIELDYFVGIRRENSFWETDLDNGSGKLNSGSVRRNVRKISTADFELIVQQGFTGRWHSIPLAKSSQMQHPGFAEQQQEKFIVDDARVRVERFISEIERDKDFRQQILTAYGERCAITGQRIHGAGKFEVQGAHIKPVWCDGPDIISNAIALSGSAHWIFERGLVTLDENFLIRISPHLKGHDDPTKMIIPGERAHLPKMPKDWPGQKFLRLHRANCFKP